MHFIALRNLSAFQCPKLINNSLIGLLLARFLSCYFIPHCSSIHPHGSPGFAGRSLAAVWEHHHTMAGGHSGIAPQVLGAGSRAQQCPASACQQSKLVAVRLQGGSSGALKRAGTVKAAPPSKPFSQAGRSKGADPGSRSAENGCIAARGRPLA